MNVVNENTERQKKMGEYQDKMRKEFASVATAARKVAQCGDVCTPLRGSGRTQHEHACNLALKHYEKISEEAQEWYSLVPKAIEFYRDNYPNEIISPS